MYVSSETFSVTHNINKQVHQGYYITNQSNFQISHDFDTSRSARKFWVLR